MDDILASIRRIIADDDALPLSRAARAAPQAPTRPAAPPPPVATAADALLGLGQRLFRNGEAAASETTAVSAFRAPAARAAASEPARAPMLKLRDFAPAGSLGLRPSLGEAAGSAEPARHPAAEGLATPAGDALARSAVAAENAAMVKPAEANSAVPVIIAAKPNAVEAKPVEAKPVEAKTVQQASAPEPKAGEPAKPDTPVASVSSLAEARLKVAPSPLRPAPAPVERIASAHIPDGPAQEAASAPEKPSETAPAQPASRRVPAPPAAAPIPPEKCEPALLSPASGARIGASFEALAESLMLRDPQMLERVAREMLRPMLKTWLDDNLPVVVERLVRAEIERIARGRG